PRREPRRRPLAGGGARGRRRGRPPLGRRAPRGDRSQGDGRRPAARARPAGGRGRRRAGGARPAPHRPLRRRLRRGARRRRRGRGGRAPAGRVPRPRLLRRPGGGVTLAWEWLGRVGFDEAAAAQEARRDRILAGDAAAQALLFLEHDPVITLGRSSSPGELLVPEAELRARGVSLRRASRGGGATAPRPRQPRLYPLLPLHRRLLLHLPDPPRAPAAASCGTWRRWGAPSGTSSPPAASPPRGAAIPPACGWATRRSRRAAFTCAVAWRCTGSRST